MTLALDADTAFREAFAAGLQPRPERWATPGAMACELDPRMVQTPALDLVDQHLVDLAQGRDKRLMIYAPPQEGKALALDTPIATPAGWSTMGELRVGDQVFDRYGEPCTVTWVSPVWRDRPCYEVLTGDGDSIVADARHEWPAKLWACSPERLHETDELAVFRSKNPQITGPADLNLPDARLPLDPYVLGAWLGDGHTGSAQITTTDMEIVERIRAAGAPCRRYPTGNHAWSLAPEAGTWRGKPSPIRAVLQELGVWGNKHIPVVYLRGSRKQRLALLQGLVDTDGYVSPRGQVEFCSINRQLALGVQHLVFSLGAKATLLEGRATINGRDCGPKYRVRFYLAEAAHLPRKARYCRDARAPRTRYVWARKVGSVPVRCIEVDSSSHTYLAGRSLLPTHNSERCSRFFPLWMLEQNPDLRVAVVSFDSDTARRWGWQLRLDIETFNGENHDVDLGLRLYERPAAGFWRVRDRFGSCFCTGVAGNLTGKPVDLLVLDDPIKDLEQANSPTYRERAWRFWQAVAIPRMGKDTVVCLVQTRWHEDDLAGRLLEHEGNKDNGGAWRVLSIPARCEDEATDPLGRALGEYMVSARGRTEKDWLEREKDVGAYVFAALFQQQPAPAEGGMFRKLWWRYFTPAGEHRVDLGGRLVDLRDCWRFGTVDLAASEKTSADWTVISAWARSLAGDLLLLDRQRVRVGEEQHFAHALPLVQRWQLDTLFVEKSQQGYTLVKEATQAGVPITPLDAETDKITRALPASKWCSGGRVWLPAAATWLDKWIDEHRGFPNARNDDQVDTLSYAVRAAITQWVPLVNRAEHATAQRRAEPEPDPFGGRPVTDFDSQAF